MQDDWGERFEVVCSRDTLQNICHMDLQSNDSFGIQAFPETTRKWMNWAPQTIVALQDLPDTCVMGGREECANGNKTIAGGMCQCAPMCPYFICCKQFHRTENSLRCGFLNLILVSTPRNSFLVEQQLHVGRGNRDERLPQTRQT